MKLEIVIRTRFDQYNEHQDKWPELFEVERIFQSVCDVYDVNLESKHGLAYDLFDQKHVVLDLTINREVKNYHSAHNLIQIFEATAKLFSLVYDLERFDYELS